MCEIREATAIAADSIQVFVICPWCGKIHMHGSNGQPDGSSGLNRWGTRVPHCHAGFADYDIVGNKFTVHEHSKNLTKRQALNAYYKSIGFSYFRLEPWK